MYRKHAIYSNEIHYKTVNMLYNMLYIMTTSVNKRVSLLQNLIRINNNWYEKADTIFISFRVCSILF